MAGTVVVVEVVVVVVEVDVVVVVEVVGGDVVVVGLVVVAGAARTTSVPEPSSPHAESVSNATHTTAVDPRRMTHSAIGNQRCNVTVAACWPERMHAGIPIP